jgi:hypothetical protein
VGVCVAPATRKYQLMIKGKMSFKRKKLTLDQKALRNALKPIGKDTRDAVRRGYPRLTGALYFSITYKVKSDKENNAYCVIGARNRYSKTVKGKDKIPNKYAKKVETATHVMRGLTGEKMVARIRVETAKEVQKMLA